MRAIGRRDDGVLLIEMEADGKGFLYFPKEHIRTPLLDVVSLMRGSDWEEISEDEEIAVSGMLNLKELE